MDVSPVVQFMKARDANSKGDTEEALAALSRALGIDQATSIIESNLDKFLDVDSIAGEGLLSLVINETKRRTPHDPANSP